MTKTKIAAPYTTHFGKEIQSILENQSLIAGMECRQDAHKAVRKYYRFGD